MADFLKNILGRDTKPSQTPTAEDADFADFAGAPDPVPVSHAAPAASPLLSNSPTLTPVIYTKWYRVWERSQLSDFKTEMFIFPFFLIVILVHVFGIRANKARAHDWAKHHAPSLRYEYASVGFGNQATEDGNDIGEEFFRAETPSEFTTYATGRANVSCMDIKITLVKRFNPLVIFGEHAIGFFFEGIPPTVERMEATEFAFDGKEAGIVPRGRDALPPKVSSSSYDGFVWAVVNKSFLSKLRQRRYDLSLTTTKDHPKLPAWATVQSESAEITDAMLTPELVKAVEDAGDLFEYLIVTDQSVDRPEKLGDTTPSKRIVLSLRLPFSSKDYTKTLPLWAYYLRLPDFLVQNAHFRPEALRKVRKTREDEIRRIQKAEEDERAEERKLQADKEKKEKRDALLKNMSSDEQKKYLEKEQAKERRRSQKKSTVRA